MKKEDKEQCDRAVEIYEYVNKAMEEKYLSYSEAEVCELTKTVMLTRDSQHNCDSVDVLEPRYAKLKKKKEA